MIRWVDHSSHSYIQQDDSRHSESNGCGMECGKGQPEVGHIAYGFEVADVVWSRMHYIHTTQLEVGQILATSSIPVYWGRIQVPMEGTFLSTRKFVTSSAHIEIDLGMTAGGCQTWAAHSWDMPMLANSSCAASADAECWYQLELVEQVDQGSQCVAYSWSLSSWPMIPTTNGSPNQ